MSATSSASRFVRRLRSSDEAGFGLIEVMVAFGIFALVSSATLGLIIGGLRDNGRSRLETVGRNVVQAQLEQLRALPFQAPAGGTLLSDFYPNAIGAGAAAGTTGYVPAAAPRDAAAGDPPTGPFFRTVLPSVPGQPAFSLTTGVQLLDKDGNPVAPPAGYDPRLSAVSRSVAIYAAARWTAFGAQRTYTVRTEVSGARSAAQRVLVRGRMVGVRVSGGLDPARKITLEAGGLTVDGSLVQDAAAAASAAGAFAGISDGLRVDGATATIAAPPDGTSPDVSGPPGSLAYGGATVAQFASSNVRGLAASGAFQSPKVGTAAQPLSSSLSADSAGSAGFSLDNRLPADAPVAKLQLLTGPIADAPGASCAPACPVVTGTGWTAGTDNAVTHAAEVGMSASSSAVRLLRTTFAPEGLVQLTLDSASLSCKVSGNYGGAPTATALATYGGSLRYWRYDPGTGSSGYVSVSLSSSQTTSPLSVPLLDTPVGVYTDSVTMLTQVLYLRDYISSWGSATSGALTAATQVRADNKSVSLTFDGLIYVNSVSLRQLSPDSSSVGVQLGNGACLAQDIR